MATDDYQLGEEVRIQTGRTDNSLGEQEVLTLIRRAKREIEAEVGEAVSDWFGGAATERALFWLTCVFVADDAGPTTQGFSVGDLEVDSASSVTATDALGRYQTYYKRALSMLQTPGSGSAPGFAVRSISRQNRDYEFEDSGELL
jgi:hypothetical protein